MTENSDYSDSNPKIQRKRFKLFVILLILFTEVLGFSMVMPVLPFLGLSLNLNRFQIGLVGSIFSFCQLFASPITGKLSDRFGRKPVLILSQTSTFAGFLLLGFTNSVTLLIIARMVDGLLGSNQTVSQAYLSDITLPQERTKIFSYSSGVFGAGLIFGPLIGGLLSRFSYSFPMFFAAGISLVTIFLIIFFLPESLEQKKEKLDLTFNDIVPIKDGIQFFKNSYIRKMLFLFFTYSMGFMLFISSFSLFSEKQLSLTSQEVGFYMTWIGILRVLLQFFLMKPLLKRAGENRTLTMGIISMIIAMTLISFSNNYWFVYLPITFLAFSTGVSRPILSSKLTKSVQKDKTGSLLGVNNSLGSIAMITSPIIGGAIIEFLPSWILPYLSSLIFAIMLVFWFSVKNKEESA